MGIKPYVWYETWLLTVSTDQFILSLLRTVQTPELYTNVHVIFNNSSTAWTDI